MKRIKFILLTISIGAAALFTAACPERISIADIEANPSKYQDKDVVIAGTVKRSYGISVPGTPLKGGAYLIDDGTGSFWVMTDDAVPSQGTEIGIKGRVGNGITWGGRNYGLGMYEKQRRMKKR